MSLPYPPASGGAIRVHGLIEGLQQPGHDITLLCFHEGDPTDVNPVIRVLTVPPPHRTKFDRLGDLLLTRQPDIAKRFYDVDFAHRLRDLLQQEMFDVVQFEGIESICYQPIVAAVQPTAKRVFDTFNAEYDLQRTIFRIDRQQVKRWPMALYSYMQVGRIWRYERVMCRLAHAVIAVSAEDAALLAPFRDDDQTHVIPNGIWTQRYHEMAVDTPFAQSQNIVFTGTMDYRPNVDAMLWFTESILPHIPDAHLTIVGRRPHPRLAHLKTMPNVTLTGWVESVQPYLHHADVYIAPLRMGSGTRLKLLEAMASGCAIVATSTAAAGLNAAARAAMSIHDAAPDFAAEVNALLRDDQRRTARRDAAQEAVRQTYDWSVLVPRLLTILEVL